MEYDISVAPPHSWCYANQFKIAKVMSTHKNRFGKGYMLFWFPNLSLTPSISSSRSKIQIL